ncbi:MAG: hypothetical protein LBV45_05530 [Xanthomonadaceae bacterium]|jgi:hypothetical protein|nr:hypothetical protein [Xanthomonadaceae bacterium]
MKEKANIPSVCLIIQVVVPGIDEMLFPRIAEKINKCCLLSIFSGAGMTRLESRVDK